MQLALALDARRDDDLMFAQQLGVTDVLATVNPGPDGRRWDAALLAGVRHRVESAGLVFAGLEGLWPHEDIVLGRPARDEEIEKLCGFIRDAGAGGIPLIAYRWGLDPAGTERADVALGTERREWPGSLTDEQMWDNLDRFVSRLVPVAADAGVRMACHPDNAAADSRSRTAPILNSAAALTRLLDTAPSPFHGLDFCHGCVDSMSGVDLLEAIRLFGGRQKIFTARLGNPGGRGREEGHAPFPDDGDMEMVRALQAYMEVGFDGPLLPCRSPGVVGDTAWGHKGHAYSTGYLRAMLQALDRTDSIGDRA